MRYDAEARKQKILALKVSLFIANIIRKTKDLSLKGELIHSKYNQENQIL